MRIDKRAARIAAINRRIGLDRLVNESGLAGLHRAAQGADDASGERGLKAKRITDGQHLLPHLDRSRISQRQRAEMFPLGINLD